jgi:quercetin dioxygenase-like cupin family protein
MIFLAVLNAGVVLQKDHRPIKKKRRSSEMFYKKDDSGFQDALEGVGYKTLAFGDKTLLAEFRLSRGSTVPEHSHPHEQTGYLISGRMRFFVQDKTMEVETGDAWNIAGDIPHGAEVLEDSVVIEVFSPVREDYLPE